MSRPILSHQITFLYTRDIETTAHFYEQVMGLELVIDQGDCKIYRITATALVGFCERASAPVEPVGIIFTLISEDVDGWYDYLTAQNIVYETPPTLNKKYQIYHSFLRDPNGYLIEIQKFLADEL